MCFFAGGTRFSEQGFGIGATQLNSSLMTLSVIGLLLPGAFHLAVQPSPDAPTEDPLTNPKEGSDILSVSRGTAVILLWIYGSYMFFMMFSHKSMYSDGHSDVQKSVKYDPGQFSNPLRRRRGTPAGSVKKQSIELDRVTGQVTPAEPVVLGEPSHLADPEIGEKHEEEEEVERPSMNIPVTIGLLIVVTVFVGVTAEWLVDSINGLTEKGSISKTFVGLILLPIVGNAAEHVTAVTVSVKDKLTLSLGVAVGSSIQIALFVIPLDVILAWIMDKPLTMLFDPYASIVLFLAVLTVNYVVQDGKSNWLEGMILMCLYVVVAVSFWFYPGVNPADALLKCT
ncbi:hypothetical protein EWM64_g4800 [Hericium alpestre]|uniref:Sodium/calcium exchanger membrane region domain-containing protein n=1 Tax=Hericium alpestre TaxID=135208 RepID=A0A4Y9ZWF3_9AGAM|nr:hypothetical protein EWM64_g4800 [Hericium alpestre]